MLGCYIYLYSLIRLCVYWMCFLKWSYQVSAWIILRLSVHVVQLAAMKAVPVFPPLNRKSRHFLPSVAWFCNHAHRESQGLSPKSSWLPKGNYSASTAGKSNSDAQSLSNTPVSFLAFMRAEGKSPPEKKSWIDFHLWVSCGNSRTGWVDRALKKKAEHFLDFTLWGKSLADQRPWSQVPISAPILNSSCL